MDDYRELKAEEDGLTLLFQAMAMGPSAAIEHQEAQGQRALVKSDALPKRINHGTREEFEAMGIVFGEDIDDLFIACQLPDGWSKRRTEHSMWSDLVDERGRKRASIFYKAAFYDRDAFMSASRRFTLGTMPQGGYGQETDHKTHPRVAYVMDGDTVVWESESLAPSEEVPWFQMDEVLQPKALAWLEEHYPDWRNVLAYWD